MGILGASRRSVLLALVSAVGGAGIFGRLTEADDETEYREGEIRLRDSGWGASLPYHAELPDTVAHEAAAHARREYGSGSNVRVRFTMDAAGDSPVDYKLLGVTGGDDE